MKILRLEAENVKRIKAVQITPDGSAVYITGKNGQGKTSVLDAIVYALGGKKTHPKQVIRRGAERAHVVVETEEFTVERTWLDDDHSKLEMRSKDGKRYSSPQKLLDDMVGSISFDPLQFLRLKSKDQMETLRSIVGLDFTDLDAEHKKLYDQRTDFNRDIRRIKDSLPPADPDAPSALVDVKELVDKLSDLEAEIREIDKIQNAILSVRDRVQSHEDRIRQLEEELEAEKAKMREASKSLAELHEKAEFFGDRPDTTEIRKKIEAAEASNAKYHEAKKWHDDYARLQDAEAEAKRLTESLEGIELEKENRIANAKFPVDGLSFDGDQVLYEGLPFEQASQSDKLRVSVAMGLALNPRLKVLLIREASFFDEDHLAVVAQMAEEAGAQVWLEVVGDQGVGVVIEDGRVKDSESVREAS